MQTSLLPLPNGLPGLRLFQQSPDALPEQQDRMDIDLKGSANTCYNTGVQQSVLYLIDSTADGSGVGFLYRLLSFPQSQRLDDVYMGFTRACKAALECHKQVFDLPAHVCEQVMPRRQTAGSRCRDQQTSRRASASFLRALGSTTMRTGRRSNARNACKPWSNAKVV